LPKEENFLLSGGAWWMGCAGYFSLANNNGPLANAIRQAACHATD